MVLGIWGVVFNFKFQYRSPMPLCQGPGYASANIACIFPSYIRTSTVLAEVTIQLQTVSRVSVQKI